MSALPDGVRVTATHLARPPARGSVEVAIATVAALVIGNGVHERLGGDGLAASGRRAFHELELWRLVTALFAHADALHLARNALPAALFAYLLYGFFGRSVHPITTVVLGAAVNALTLLAYPPEVRLVGASGAVYEMAGFWLASYVLIERRHSPARRLLRATGFALVVLAPTAFVPNVSYLAHGIGVALGLVAGAVHFRIRRTALRAAETLAFDEEPN